MTLYDTSTPEGRRGFLAELAEIMRAKLAAAEQIADADDRELRVRALTTLWKVAEAALGHDDEPPNAD